MTQINGEYVNASVVAKLVKNVLAKRYGSENVSVHKNSGTASGWIDATIARTQPRDCFCKKDMPYCERCRSMINETADEARKIVYAELAAKNAKFSTYYGDMDNEPRDCFVLQVRIK